MVTAMSLLEKQSVVPASKCKWSWLSKVAKTKPKLSSPYKTERETAEFLNFSVSKLRRLRKAGAIGCNISVRTIRYTPDQIEEFVKSMSQKTCPAPDLKLKAIGFQSGKEVHSTMQHGMKKEAIKLAVVHLAQQTFK